MLSSKRVLVYGERLRRQQKPILLDGLELLHADLVRTQLPELFRGATGEAVVKKHGFLASVLAIVFVAIQRTERMAVTVPRFRVRADQNLRRQRLPEVFPFVRR